MDYLAQMNLILGFIKYCLENVPESSDHGVGLKMMSDLWEIFVEGALLGDEADLFFAWLIELLQGSGSGVKVNIEDIVTFYKEKFSNFEGNLGSA